MLFEWISLVNDWLWGRGQILIFVLLFAGVWFTWHCNFIQIRGFKHMFSVVLGKNSEAESGLSSFQALCIGLSARVGTGNLAGVAMAVSLGGSGAVFWMWLIAILGMATGFAESVLGQAYKIKNEKQEFRGGPAYYIVKGLGQKWLALLFALCLFLGYGMTFSAMQANTIADAMGGAFEVPTYVSGAVITLIAGAILVGGMKSIASFAEKVVPFMGIAFVMVALIVTLMNLTQLPALLLDIVLSAFGLTEAGAGALGAAIKNGIQRGLYSNEAGAGSVPQAAASAAPTPNHPVAQGYVQMLGVFIDTIVLCSCTAFIILFASLGFSGEAEGIRMTQTAMNFHFGQYGEVFVTMAITLFAFTSVVANYAYAESNLNIIGLDNKPGRLTYTALYLGMVFWGASATLREVWVMADVALGLMTLVNVIAIVQLTPTVKRLSQDYHEQLAAGVSPKFQTTRVQVQGETTKGFWT